MNKYNSECLIKLLEEESKKLEKEIKEINDKKNELIKNGIHTIHSKITLDILESIKNEYNNKLSKYNDQLNDTNNKIEHYKILINYFNENTKNISLNKEIENLKTNNENIKKQIEELKKEKKNIDQEYKQYHDFRDDITEDYIYWLERHFWKCTGDIPSGKNDFICYKH